MLIPNHPGDERLAAWAAAEPEARGDAVLVDHVPSCPRCTEVVADLGALRAALAELPDVAPPRPLRLLPPVADAPAASGAGGWVRRLFAPVMTAGAALTLVGILGTAAPAFGTFEIFQNVGSNLSGGAGAEEAVGRSAGEPGDAATASGDAPAAAAASPPSDGEQEGQEASAAPDMTMGGDGDDATAELLQEEADRPIWPMVLFSGIAILIGAMLLRWILVPRAG